jgi:NAD(P)-dependent dehydrogenase (short-subunit alcohol dehydrogenase family)
VRSFARSFSADLLARRIRVNAVSPGLIDTPILRGVGQSEHPGQTDAEFKEYIAGAAKLIPIGRLGAPDEIASAVLFLASDASRYILGSELVVDGGFAELWRAPSCSTANSEVLQSRLARGWATAVY